MDFTTGRFMLSLAFLFILVFLWVFSPFQHCDHLAWGRDSWSICFCCTGLLHLFVYSLHVKFSPFPLPLGVCGWLRLVSVALPGLSINLLLQKHA